MAQGFIPHKNHPWYNKVGDKMKAKDIMYKEKLNFVLVSAKRTLKSSLGGIKPLYEAYLANKDYFKDSQLADRVIGNAAAILLIDGGIREVYTDLIGKEALAMLEARGILVEYRVLTDKILNRTKDGLCPMENLSKDNPSAEELIERMGGFFGK